MPTRFLPAVMASLRAFVAVPAPPEEPLVALLEELGSLDADLRPVAPGHLHFTLSFLGEVPAGAVSELALGMAEAARGVPAFRARLRGVGAFPSARRPRVVWVGLDDPRPMVALATRMREALAARGHPGDDKDLRAHLTLARVKVPRGEASRSVRGAEEIGSFLKRHGADMAGEFDVREVVLYESVLSPQGPEYEALATAPLEG